MNFRACYPPRGGTLAAASLLIAALAGCGDSTSQLDRTRHDRVAVVAETRETGETAATGRLTQLVRRDGRLAVATREPLEGRIVDTERGSERVTLLVRAPNRGRDRLVDFSPADLSTVHSTRVSAGTDVDRLRSIARRGPLEVWAIGDTPADRLLTYRRSRTSSDWRVSRNSEVFARGRAASLRPVDLTVHGSFVYVLCERNDDTRPVVVPIDVHTGEPVETEGTLLSVELGRPGARSLSTSRAGGEAVVFADENGHLGVQRVEPLIGDTGPVHPLDGAEGATDVRRLDGARLVTLGARDGLVIHRLSNSARSVVTVGDRTGAGRPVAAAGDGRLLQSVWTEPQRLVALRAGPEGGWSVDDTYELPLDLDDPQQTRLFIPSREGARFLERESVQIRGDFESGRDRIFGPPRGAGAARGSRHVLENARKLTIELNDRSVRDGPGADLVIFENAFAAGGDPLTRHVEPATVSFSRDGESWKTYPSSRDSTFSVRDPRHYRGFAGIDPVYSHPDDSEIPADSPAAGGDTFDLRKLPIDRARYIRLSFRRFDGLPAVVSPPDPDAVLLRHTGSATP